MSDYQRRDFAVSLRNAERAMDVSVATLMAWAEAGVMQLGEDGTVMVSELERVTADRDGGDASLVRAMLQLARFTTTYSTGDIAELLGFGRDTVVNLCDCGHIQAYRTPHGYRRVSRESLARYLADNPGPLAEAMGLATPVKPGTSPTPRKRSPRKSAAAKGGE